MDLYRTVSEQEQVDCMFWNLEDGSKEGMRYFSIAGSLWKELEVVSSPHGARLNIKGRTDGEFSATHTTPVKGLALPAGDYEFSLSLPGYSSWRRNVRVDENTSSVMQINLDKSFRLKVVDAATGENLAADVAISGSANLRGKTPMTVSLPAGMARISLTKEPEYEPVVLVRNIEELGGELLIEMELRNPYLQVEFKDYESGRGIDSATVG